ncbi:hypothetical protein [Saccharopolyspora phatthalungensis]|uniref:Uncharacterized protein n=1 Tax=Saccharopolyspora phatthalungensis TaxID=664693 RepID=A0A840QIT0_9PSEU|nr:hypothetical protein [Saccharopolyspora phatthalungensis]MBB5157353.1 hypothetical protein [Saccharopolyspora phatthalungensis]
MAAGSALVKASFGEIVRGGYWGRLDRRPRQAGGLLPRWLRGVLLAEVSVVIDRDW